MRKLTRKVVTRTVMGLALLAAVGWQEPHPLAHMIATVIALFLFPIAVVVVVAIRALPLLLMLGGYVAWRWHRDGRPPAWVARFIPRRLKNGQLSAWFARFMPAWLKRALNLADPSAAAETDAGDYGLRGAAEAPCGGPVEVDPDAARLVSQMANADLN